MSVGRIGGYEVVGDADPGRVRVAGWVDGLAATVLLMLAWPIPVLRAALPWSVHGPLIVLGILVADLALRSVSMMLWGRTTVMYLLDLGVDRPEPRVPVGKALAWSAGWTLALVPSLVGLRRLAHPATGLPARLSGLVTRSTG